MFTSKTTCCSRSGNFCTIVTGWPEVRETPYMGAVVLYLVLHSLDGVPVHVVAGVVAAALAAEKTNLAKQHTHTQEF